MLLIGNKQLGLGGQGAQAAAGQTMQKACCDKLVFISKLQEALTRFLFDLFGFRKQFLNCLWNKLCLHSV